MKKTRPYKSDALAAIHETMSDMYASGGIDKKTMLEFDESCLTSVQELSAEEIKAIPEHEAVSQTVFALYLNVSKESVSQWERGQKKPAGTTLKLLSLVKKKGLASIAWSEQTLFITIARLKARGQVANEAGENVRQ